MFVILFTIFYIAINIYIAWEIYSWLKTLGKPLKSKAVKIAFATIYSAFALLMFVSFFTPASDTKKVIAKISNYHQGFLINLFIVLIAAHIIGPITRLFKITKKGFFKEEKHKRICGLICAAIVVLFSAYGFINANHIQITNYDVTVDKHGEDIKIVLISDLHLGYNIGADNMNDMAEKINKLNPDLVCIAGDIYDNDFDSIDDTDGVKNALASINSKYGTYACWGNHDISDKLFGGFTVNSDEGKKMRDDRMGKLLSDAGIKLLQDETAVINDKFTIIGRLDYHKPGTSDSTRKAISDFEFDKSKLAICLDHEPKELQETADAGIDIDLNGHTHNGQIFPGTLLIKLFWENAAGYITKTGVDGNTMHNIVTEGVGVFGPFMRTCCKSEIVEINIHFTN